MRKNTVLWLVVLLIVIVTGRSEAQTTTTTIVGTVTDQSGATIPNAQVTATNIATNLARTVPSNEQGEYRIEFLPVGTYSLKVNAAGFKNSVRNDIVLRVNDTARIDVSLTVGQVGETVEVSGGAPLVNTSNAELGRTVQNAEITELPIVNRNAYTLLDLTPGVQSNVSGITLGFPEQRTTINGGVDGGTGSVNYYLDGGTNMTGLRNTGNSLPNPDAIQEFRVQTNSYSAEFGRYAGGVINVLTKSGTNQFHGSLFEFVRNTAFNANSWGSAIAKPPLHRNQFGGTFGGPIKKDKTFFFGSYAGLREITGRFLNTTVPTALERTGDFSQSGVFVQDPLKAGTCSATVQTRCFTDPSRATAANPTGLNIIPAGRIDPVSLKIVNGFIPVANVGANTYQGTIKSPFNTNEVLVKIDHALTSNQQLTLNYFESSGENTIPAGTGQIPWSQQSFVWRQHNANLSDTWTINPHLVNQAWLSYTRNFGGRLNLPATSLADLGSAFTMQGTPSLPNISITGLFTLSQAIAGPLAGTNFYSFRDVASYTNGHHSWKFGMEESLDKDEQVTLLNNYGTFSFNGSANLTRSPWGDFLIGSPNSATQDAPVAPATNSWYTAFFAQDDYRIHPRLTLNLGVRYDLQTAPTDPGNRQSTFVAGVQSTVNPKAPLGLLFAGDSYPGGTVQNGIVPLRKNHFSPRLGFAWDPFGDGKTSIRGGAGIFFGSISGNEWNTTSNFEPFAVRLTLSNTNSPTGATLSNPYRNLNGGNPFPYTGRFIAAGPMYAIDTNFHWPYSYQLNLSIQRQVTNDLSVTAAYVGTLSHNLPFATDLNYPLFNANTATASNSQSRRPIQTTCADFTTGGCYGSVQDLNGTQTANYNALQLSATKRMGHHVSLNSFYTFSKTLSSVSLQGATNMGGAQDFANLKAEKGRSDTDQRHVFVASLTYQPDYYSGRNSILRNVVNGWSISPIIKLRSGLPFTISNGADANLDGTNNDRAQVVGDPHIANPSAAAWFNTSAFAQNPAIGFTPAAGATPAKQAVFVDGNSPRNFLDAPGFRDVDLAISRSFKVRESASLMFRAEAINAFNMVSLGTPGATWQAPSPTSKFGVITGASPMRQIQLGARLTF